MIRLRARIPTSDFVQIRADITKSIKQTFDREKIEIPYPHQVEFVKEAPERALPSSETDA